MRLSLVILVVATGVVAAAVAAPSASACCIWTPEADRIARADVIFEGTALEGATETGIQRFRVDRYLKGTGPEVISVKTDFYFVNGLYSGSTVNIGPSAGTEWRIFGRLLPDGVVETNACVGSKLLPLPPLGQEPPPPRPSDPGLLIVQPTPQPPPEPPPADARSSSGVGDQSSTVTPEATPPLKTYAPRPKAKRPRLAKKNKKAKKGAVRPSRTRRR